MSTGIKKALVHRNIDDLTVLIYQRTLYITNKQKQGKVIAAKEATWMENMGRLKQTHLAVNMQYVPDKYYEDVYLYLTDADYHRERIKILKQAEKEGNLAPWSFELTQNILHPSATLFKTDEEIAKALKMKQDKLARRLKPKVFKKKKKSTWLNKLEWAALTRYQKRRFRKTKKVPRVLKRRLRLFNTRKLRLKAHLRAKLKNKDVSLMSVLNSAKFHKRPKRPTTYLFTRKSRFWAVKFYKRKPGPVKYGLYKRIMLPKVIGWLYWRMPSSTKATRKPIFKWTRNKPLTWTLANFLTNTTNHNQQLTNTLAFTQPTLVIDHRRLPKQENTLSSLALCQLYTLNNNKVKIIKKALPTSWTAELARRLRLRRKRQFRRRARRYFLRKVIRQGKDVLKYRMYYSEKDNYRLNVFKRFFKRQFGRFRHISKNKLFISLFRAHFKSLTGFKERELMFTWFQFRRKYTAFWGVSNLVSKFSQSILLMPKHLIMFFGIAPTLSTARALINAGALIVNGVPCVNNVFVKPGDTLQITPHLWARVRKLYFYQRWSYMKLKLSRVSFFQIDWSMLMFTLVTWPKAYELLPPSYLSERWIRFYIRHFPVRQRKYQKVKLIWKTYPRPKSKHSKKSNN